MIFIDKMKNMRIYRIGTFLPTLKDNKKKNSAILLMTPNYESSKKLMNNPLFTNAKRYMSYYLEKDVSYYIGSKNVEEVEESLIMENQQELQAMLETKRSELPDDAFGVPSKRKFPLDTEKHVRSAIKFFNYVDPEDEEELARNIIKAMKKFNITDVKVSEKNRFSKYYKSPVNESSEVKKCKFCGSNDIGVKIAGEPIYICKDCGKYLGTVPFRSEAKDLVSNDLPTPNIMNTEEFLKEVSREDVLNLGDKVLFFNESNKGTNTQLRRLLFNSRIKKRKEIALLYDQVKKDNPWIKYTYPVVSRYNKLNLFVDLYYYNAIFFQNNVWTLKKGMNLYLEFMDKLINHPNIKDSEYKMKTIFIPIKEWDTGRNSTLWNYRYSINPISCIYDLMFNGNINQLKKTFGDRNIMFISDTCYFKINFSEIDAKDIKKIAAKFRVFVTKICNNEEFSPEDIDTVPENKEDKEVIKAKIIDKIETAKGIDITKQVSDASNRIKTIAHNTDKAVKDYNKVSDKVLVPGGAKNITVQDKKDALKNNIIVPKPKYFNDDIDEDERAEELQNDEERKNADIEKLAQIVAAASEESDSEEDAMDNLDNNDELKRILISLGNDDQVNISAARSSRMTELDQKLLDKEINGKTVSEILSDDSDEDKTITTDIEVSSPNKDEWKGLSYMNFDKNYNIDRDIIKIFRSFKDCSRPIVVRDINVTDTSTSEDRIHLYEVDMEDYRGKRFKIKLDIPIMEDNRFLLRGSYKSIQTQSFNMPIVKTELDTCELLSNYNKILLKRFGSSKGNSLPAVSKFIKAANKYTGRKIKFNYGNNTKVCSKYYLPIDYIDLAGVFNKIETSDFIIYFNQDEIRKDYTVEEGKGFPFAYNKKLNAVEYFPPDIVDSFINMIAENIFKIDKDFEDLYAAQTKSNICYYVRASIMNAKIPVVVICAYHVGLSATMDRAMIKYQLVDKLTREIKADVNKDWIEFNDGYVVYDVNYESSLLMNGLKSCSTEMYNLSEIDDRAMYYEFLDNYGGRIKADGLDNFKDLFVDPMIKESLEYYHLPTDYIDILLYGNSLLNDNKYIRHTDLSSRRFRRYQLISVYTYKVLSSAYGIYANALKHNSNLAQFSVKQSAVVDAFLTDSITSDDSVISALRDVETTNSITTKGPSGLNVDRAYSLDKRSYDNSMLNVLGMSTGFAGNVGITRQTTINANVTKDGYVKDENINQDNMNDANTLTATESIIPFVSTRDDPMRTAMSFIQTSKHAVRTENSDPLLVTNGADEVMPYMTTDRFAFKAKKDGHVIEVTDEYILVEYEDGKKDYINLAETIEKNSDGGYYVPLKLDASDGIKVGVKFKKDQILAYDKLSFSNSIGESNNIAYNVGKLAKVAILNTDEGFEDSGIMSESMAQKLATRVVLKYDAVVDMDSRVYYIAKVGDHIEASDNLLLWEDSSDDENTEDILNNLEGSELGKRVLKSSVTGTLTGIKMYRTVELDAMSESLKAIVTEYEKPLKKKAKILKDNGISQSKVAAHYVLPPTGKLKKSQDAVYIEFFVEYMDTVGVGDKIVYNAANKAVEKGLFPKGKEPYTDFRPNEKIDAFVSDISISKRLVTSIPIYGSLQKLMIELDRSVKDIMGIEYDDSTV